MTPLKKAARYLTKQIETAGPEVAAAGERVLLSIAMHLENINNEAARRITDANLHAEIDSLESAWKSR